MILITVGTTLFPFQRMTTLVEHISHIRIRKEKIIFQYGHTPPHFLDTSVESVAFLPHRKLMKHMQQARIIICHGGPATIFQALSFGKIPWVLPRRKQYGEHLTDHQIDFSDFMAKKKLIRLITDRTPLSDIMEEKQPHPPVWRDNRNLIGYLDSLMQQP